MARNSGKTTRLPRSPDQGPTQNDAPEGSTPNAERAPNRRSALHLTSGARLSAPVHICRSALVTAPRIVSRTTGLSPPRRSRPPSVALLRLRPADGKRTLGESGSGTDGSPDYREGSTPGRPEAGRTREARDPVVLGGLPPPFLPAGSHSCEWAENSRGSYSQFPTVVKRTRSVIQELSGTSGKRNDLQGSG